MITVIGTSHISPQSVEVIFSKKPDCVAVELCPERYHALKYGVRKPSMRFGLTTYLFSIIQQHLSHKTHIMPGAEMMAAIEAGLEVGAKVVLIDAPIGITLHKIQKVPPSRKMSMIFRLLLDSLKGGKAKIDLNKVPSQALIDKAMTYMRKDMPEFYEILVVERNKYMHDWIKKLAADYKNIVVVVGAGHKKELEKMIKDDKI
jgi:pheromone shutdown protein TraB